MQSISLRKAPLQITGTTWEWLVLGIRLACIFLFVFSGYEKLVTHIQFLKGLEKVAIVGNYAFIISWLVPIAEIVISLLLVFPKTLKLGLNLFTSLMVIFTLYIGGVILWAENLPCHCNILVKQLSWPQHIIFNLAFIVIAIIGLWHLKTKRN